VRRRERFADMDVAVAGGGFGGLDADGDDGLSAAGEVEGIVQHLLKLFLVGDDVVGGEDGHHTGGGARPDQGGAQGDRGAGVASARFGDDVRLGQLGQLPADLGGLGLVGDDEDVLEPDEREDAVDRLLEEGAFAEVE